MVSSSPNNYSKSYLEVLKINTNAMRNFLRQFEDEMDSAAKVLADNFISAHAKYAEKIDDMKLFNAIIFENTRDHPEIGKTHIRQTFFYDENMVKKYTIPDSKDSDLYDKIGLDGLKKGEWWEKVYNTFKEEGVYESEVKTDERDDVSKIPNF